MFSDLGRLAPPPAHQPVWTRDQAIGVFGAILLAWLIAAAIWPLTGMVVPWDSKNHFYPMMRYLGEALRHGELPFWNPYHFSGHPSVADPQSLLFTPTMLLFAWLVPSPSMEVFDAVVFAHFLPGAFGMALLFRARGWHPAGAVIAALIFMAGGSASARLQHTGIVFSYGYFPLALWLLEGALARRSFPRAVMFAVVAALMTVGRDQVAFLLAMSLIGAVVWAVIQAERPALYVRQRAAVLAVMAVVGGLLLAIPTLLTLQFLETSTRPSFGFGVVAMGSLPPSSLATVLFGNVFGSLRWTYDYWGPDWHTVLGGTWTDRATNYLFAGTLPALLLLWHGVAGGRLFAREFRYWLALGAAATLYALGRYTPAFEAVFDIVPGVDLYRRPADATFLINIFLAVASGYLVHRYLAEGIPRVARSSTSPTAILRIAVALGALMGGILVALSYAVPAHRTALALVEIGAGLALASAAAFALSRANPRGRMTIAAALIAVTGAELAVRNIGSSLNAEPASRYAVFRELPPEQLQGLQILKKELERRHAAGERPRVEILGLAGAWQNASMVLGIEDTLGYNPLRLADYERAVGPGENAVDPTMRTFPRTFRSYRGRLASLLGLDYLVLDRPIERLPDNVPRPRDGVETLYGSGTMWVYKLNSGAPRAYVATKLIPVDSEEVLQQEDLPQFDRSREALIDDYSAEDVLGNYGLRKRKKEPEAAVATVRITDYRPNTVRLTVETDRDGVLILHDIYYPGWEATVDGAKRPILRTNLLFRGVEVPAGRHVVEFRFRPLSLENLVTAAESLMEGEEPAETVQ